MKSPEKPRKLCAYCNGTGKMARENKFVKFLEEYMQKVYSIQIKNYS